MPLPPSKWIPVRWPSEILKPEALTILDGSPFNTLVVEQGNAAPLLAAAQSRNWQVVEWPSADVWTAPDAVWPRVPVRAAGGGNEAGPTGQPWVNSNGWRCLLGRAKAPDKPVWIASEPPADIGMFPNAFDLAVADAAAYGGQWVVSLPPNVWTALEAREPDAVQVWRSIGRRVAYFHSKPILATVANLGVVSDFAGPNAYLAKEVLNLAGRRRLPVRVIDRDRLDKTSLAGLKALVWVDQKAPAGPDAGLVKGFIEGGGLFVGAPSAAGVAEAGTAPTDFDGRYRVVKLGSGRAAISRLPWSDPYQIASDAHLLLGRKQDLIRSWNTGSTGLHLTSGKPGAALLHLVNYTGRRVDQPISVYLAYKYLSAYAASSELIRLEPKEEGVEIFIPPFTTYLGIELRS